MVEIPNVDPMALPPTSERMGAQLLAFVIDGFHYVVRSPRIKPVLGAKFRCGRRHFRAEMGCHLRGEFWLGHTGFVQESTVRLLFA